MGEPDAAPTVTVRLRGWLRLPLPHPYRPNPNSLGAHPRNPLGKLEGEGQWSVYFTDPRAGRWLTGRFFSQTPNDPIRCLRLWHLTWRVPTCAMCLDRLNRIPINTSCPAQSPLRTEKQTGCWLYLTADSWLLTENMVPCQTGSKLLPPRDGLGTVVIYQDGRVAIGEWGKDIKASDDMAAWRQNCPPIIREGQIHPKVEKNL